MSEVNSPPESVYNLILKKEDDIQKAPRYVFSQEERAQEEFNSSVKEQQEQGAMKRLSDEERQAVLEGLKKNLDELHHEYQGLPLVIYTLARKAQKERLEEAMNQLEKDINLFEKFKNIYIPNNN